MNFLLFFFNDPAPTEISTLSLHDALPISCQPAVPKYSWPSQFQFPEPYLNSIAHTRRNGAIVGKQAHRRVLDRKSTRLNSSHSQISYAVFCLKTKPGARTCTGSGHPSGTR